MRNLAKQLKLNSATWSLVGGLMLLGLLGACTEVQVTLDTCATRTGVGTPLPPDGAGACRAPVLLTGPKDPNVNDTNAVNTAKSNQYITDHNHQCKKDQYMCQPSPGTALCGGVNKPCKTFFTPDVSPDGLIGTCVCGSCP